MYRPYLIVCIQSSMFDLIWALLKLILFYHYFDLFTKQYDHVPLTIIIQIAHFSKYLLFCSTNKSQPYEFGTTWGWVNEDRIIQLSFANNLDLWHCCLNIICSTSLLCCSLSCDTQKPKPFAATNDKSNAFLWIYFCISWKKENNTRVNKSVFIHRWIVP